MGALGQQPSQTKGIGSKSRSAALPIAARSLHLGASHDVTCSNHLAKPGAHRWSGRRPHMLVLCSKLLTPLEVQLLNMLHLVMGPVPRPRGWVPQSWLLRTTHCRVCSDLARGNTRHLLLEAFHMLLAMKLGAKSLQGQRRGNLPACSPRKCCSRI